MVDAYLGIGSNLGNKKENMLEGIKLLANHDRIKIINVSSFYETAPVGYQEQDWFLNAVLKISTDLQPLELLDYCQDVEKRLKRKRIFRWGPRTLDIDILLYGDLSISGKRLFIPHPRMTERAFVLIPLLEIAPDLLVNGISIRNLAAGVKGQEIIKGDSPKINF